MKFWLIVETQCIASLQLTKISEAFKKLDIPEKLEQIHNSFLITPCLMQTKSSNSEHSHRSLFTTHHTPPSEASTANAAAPTGHKKNLPGNSGKVLIYFKYQLGAELFGFRVPNSPLPTHHSLLTIHPLTSYRPFRRAFLLPFAFLFSPVCPLLCILWLTINLKWMLHFLKQRV